MTRLEFSIVRKMRNHINIKQYLSNNVLSNYYSAISSSYYNYHADVEDYIKLPKELLEILSKLICLERILE